MSGFKKIGSFLLLPACLALLMLSACEINHVKDEASAFYSVAVGSTLVLNQQLVIDGGQVAVYLQKGVVMAYQEVDKYWPNCKFEVYTISEKPRRVQADSFEIIRVVDEIESSSIKNNTRLTLLENDLMRAQHAFGLFDHSEVFNYATLLYLHSNRQKDVYRMTCQHWESTLDDKHLSIKQMRSAMGEVFSLQIKD